MEKFTSKTVQTVFNGTTDVELVSAPPAGQAFVLESVIAENNSGGTRVLSVVFDKNGTKTSLFALALLNGARFVYPSTLLSTAVPLNKSVVLSASDETIIVDSNGTITDSVIATFNIIEAEIV